MSNDEQESDCLSLFVIFPKLKSTHRYVSIKYGQPPPTDLINISFFVNFGHVRMCNNMKNMSMKMYSNLSTANLTKTRTKKTQFYHPLVRTSHPHPTIHYSTPEFVLPQTPYPKKTSTRRKERTEGEDASKYLLCFKQFKQRKLKRERKIIKTRKEM